MDKIHEAPNLTIDLGSFTMKVYRHCKVNEIHFAYHLCHPPALILADYVKPQLTGLLR